MTRIDLKHVSSLARLHEPTDPEKQAAQQEGFQNILRLVDTIRELDTKDVEPSRHPTLERVILRGDQQSEGDSEARVAASSPAAVGSFFSVPKVVK